MHAPRHVVPAERTSSDVEDEGVRKPISIFTMIGITISLMIACWAGDLTNSTVYWLGVVSRAEAQINRDDSDR